MVYYPISGAQLLREIRNENAGWIGNAAQRTSDNIAGQRLVWKDTIWSKIKPFYMRWQWNKCVYCEFPLGGRSTQDVEHYRPKSKISVWPKSTATPYNFPTGVAQADGYYWLAYNPENYAASCKDCNSALKSDSFPIMGNRGAAPEAVAKLNRVEKPLLLFPFGDWGDNPADYFVYEGIFVRPKPGLRAEKRRRAQVTIDFFQLNKRANLLRLRHTVMGIIWTAVKLREESTDEGTVNDAVETILENILDEAPQTLCARSFHDLMENDKAQATKLRNESREFLRRLGYLHITED